MRAQKVSNPDYITDEDAKYLPLPLSKEEKNADEASISLRLRQGAAMVRIEKALKDPTLDPDMRGVLEAQRDTIQHAIDLNGGDLDDGIDSPEHEIASPDRDHELE